MAAIEADSKESERGDDKRIFSVDSHVSVDKLSDVETLLPDPDAGLSDEERAANERKLLWKLDLRLIPWLSLLYLISFLDRTNIGNAKLDGLLQGAHLTQNQYNAALTIFFVSYSVFEPLTNVMLKRFRPSIFISTTMLLWGIVMTCMGLVSSYSGLMAARWFLGLAEAGLFPGIAFYLSCWYKRDELGVRISIFFSSAAISGSFGGLLAAAISKMDTIGGKGGWSWIFILEGLFTVIIATASYWMIVDFPDQATFLSADDKARALRRLASDNQGSAKAEKFQMKYVWAAYTDWKTYLWSFIYMGHDMPLYAFSLFLPSIINELGYSSIRAQLLSVPPYAAGCLLTIALGFLGDKIHHRGFINIAVSLVGITGFAMLLGTSNPAVAYAGTFLGALGIYPCIGNNTAWISNNIEGVYKRGIVLGTAIAWGNLSGVISSNIYRGKDAPRYTPGHASVLAFLVVFLLGGSVLMEILLRLENRRRDLGKRDYLIEGKTPQEIHDLGDKKPSFRYIL